MDAILHRLDVAVSQLLGRASGPLHFRLILQPLVASALAFRAGRRDAREGQPPFLWTVLTEAEERRRLLRSGWKDVGKIFLVALALDLVYQVVALHGVYPLQSLIVAAVLALVPYSLLRGLITRIAQRSSRSGRGESEQRRGRA